ncbi:MAG: ABC transporter substrate binding protein [Thermodesulfobacteriota bacterium]
MTTKKILAIILLCLLPTTTPSPARADDQVAILLSDSEDAYLQPVATFRESMEVPVEIYNLEGDIHRAPALMEKILATRPALIFALGAKAAFIAKTWTVDQQEIPVVFAMVLNWQKYQLTAGQDNVAGIASDVAPGTQFLNMTMFAPASRRVGVIYSEAHSAEIIAEARKAAELLGIELHAQPIGHPREFRRAYKKMAGQIDSFWVLTDPVVYTWENVGWLEKNCLRDRLVCIGQSQNVAKLGILLAVDPDIPNLGYQAASLARNILFRRGTSREIGVMPPLGTRLYLNLNTAKKLGLTISPQAMGMVNEIVAK